MRCTEVARMARRRGSRVRSRAALALTMALAALSGPSLVAPAAFAQEAEIRVARLTPDVDIPTQLGHLPRPIGAKDAARYRMIFELQRDGHWSAADHVVSQLGSDLLLGHVLAQRYLHPTAWRSSYEELHGWLEHYSDLPQAAAVYALALQRRPPGAAPPKEPVAGYLGGSGQELLEERDTGYAGPDGRSAARSREVRDWLAGIAALVSKDRPTQARSRLARGRAPAAADPVEHDLARWTIAKGYFANRMDEEALALAAPAAERSGAIEPRIHWTAGLAAWRSGRIETAARHFAALARSGVSPEDAAMGGFWAARAWLRLRRPDLHRRYLELAAKSDEFYGLLAKERLGLPITFDWYEAGLRGDMMDLLERFPGSRRAIALGQIGQPALAEQEIRKLAARARPQLTQALAALAESLRLPAAQMRVAQRLRLQDGRRHDGATYPMPAWRPDGGYLVDRALLFSLMRAESGFDPEARSHAGALGLMQVLPSTARVVAERAQIAYEGEATLTDPAVNLTLAQAYVDGLIANHIVEGSLIHVAVAYNAGLKRLQDWVARFADLEDDPLLYLESIPVPETRLYAKKVLANLWAYRIRLDQPASSMAQLAANAWPIYASSDTATTVARRD